MLHIHVYLPPDIGVPGSSTLFLLIDIKRFTIAMRDESNLNVECFAIGLT
jgi:hypothetical protein